MKIKKIPQRTCVGCKAVKPKKELVRLVRTPEGEVLVDPTGKKAGRGAYICPSTECLEKAFKGPLLAQALEFELTSEIKDNLKVKMLDLIK
ncbi:MAG: RNase P modulator RnpM [Bacteroidota bacterium]